jgi:hypothetical protein
VALALTVIDTTVPVDILRGYAPAVAWAGSVERQLVGPS